MQTSFMECVRRIYSFSREEERYFEAFLENGSALLEGLIASSSSANGKHNIPIRNFAGKELMRATSNFISYVSAGGTGEMFRGSIEQRPILVKKFYSRLPGHNLLSNVVQDVVISSQMSHLKHVLKLLGCCLELEIPALVYDYSGNDRILYDLLHERENGLLSWKSRLRIAKDISSAIVFLHTAFPTLIIHRDLNPRNIIVDQDGVAKLVDFSLTIALPPGESQVEDMVIGMTGYGDPEYIATGIITEKTDVYMFGIILLMLLTGRDFVMNSGKYEYQGRPLVDLAKDHVEKNKLNEILDPEILREAGGTTEQGLQLQVQDFATLSLACVQPKGESRPEIMGVAKELRRIERQVHPC